MFAQLNDTTFFNCLKSEPALGLASGKYGHSKLKARAMDHVSPKRKGFRKFEGSGR